MNEIRERPNIGELRGKLADAAKELRDYAAGRGKKAGSNATGFPGRGAAYLVRRLKRDAPAIADALGRGEYPSARAAARAQPLAVLRLLHPNEGRHALRRLARRAAARPMNVRDPVAASPA
jgi:hypothetical protein